MLSGKSYPNNSIVSIREIGVGNNALLCVTDNQNCCKNSGGEFYYPDKSRVNARAFGESFYRNRHSQVVRLNRRNDAVSPLGTYRCDILDSMGKFSSMFIKLVA